MTPIAAEGIPVGSDLAGCVATGPADLARLILALHGDPGLNRRVVQAGRALLDRAFSPACMDAALAAAVMPSPAIREFAPLQLTA